MDVLRRSDHFVLTKAKSEMDQSKLDIGRLLLHDKAKSNLKR